MSAFPPLTEMHRPLSQEAASAAWDLLVRETRGEGPASEALVLALQYTSETLMQYAQRSTHALEALVAEMRAQNVNFAP